MSCRLEPFHSSILISFASDTALLDSVTKAEDALGGIANVTASLSADAAPSQDDLNLITTSLVGAQTALDGAQV